MKRVLLLNASPKDNGATEEILKLVKSYLPADVSAESLCLGNLDIHFCLGEKACYKTGSCFQHDDVNLILDSIDDSDIIIISVPSYWADIPAQFKAFIDRCTPFADTNEYPEHRVIKPGKKCYTFALRTGTRTMECEHLIATVAHWCGHMGIEAADSLAICSVNDKNDIIKHKDEIKEKVNLWFR